MNLNLKFVPAVGFIDAIGFMVIQLLCFQDELMGIIYKWARPEMVPF